MAFSYKLVFLFIALNSVFYLDANYVGSPTDRTNIRSGWKRSLELSCTYEGNDESGQFLDWYSDNNVIDGNKKDGPYSVQKTDKKTTLTIREFGETEQMVKNWYVKTDKSSFETPENCRFSQIHFLPAPHQFKTEREEVRTDLGRGTIRRYLGETVRIICVIYPESELKNSFNDIQWQFSADDKTFSDLPETIQKNGNEIIIERLEKAHRGFYQCSLNDVKSQVLLRVKDRYAALWPFLGIVASVILAVGVILLLEKRQKKSKKTIVTIEEKHDPVREPLVSGATTVSEENPDRKRTVQA